MENSLKSVQNGTKLDLDNSSLNSELAHGLGQIRVFETDDEMVIKHHVTARERLYNEYSKFAVKTAQSTIEMCRIVFEAKTTLVKTEYECFLKDVGRKSEDSTIRKFLAIGERYDDLIAYTNLLPASWTSMYEITQIPSDVFLAMVAMGDSMAHLTGADIKKLKGNGSIAKPSTPAASSATPTMPSASVTSPAIASVAKDTEVSVDAMSDKTSNEHADAQNAADTTVSCASAASSDSTVSTDPVPEEPDRSSEASTPMLECVSKTASLNVNAAAEEQQSEVSYSVVICFKSKPSEEALYAMADSLTTLLKKHRIDAEISTKRD